MKKPIVTLFMLQSVDGKISTGPTDNFDFDLDIPKLEDNPSVGLYQYYEAELETDLWSFNTGRTMSKIGINEKIYHNEKSPVIFVLLDNSYMKISGINYLCQKFHKVILITSNKNHPAYLCKKSNLQILSYQNNLDFYWLLNQLYQLGCRELTLQAGSTINCEFLRNHLIDKVHLIVSPILIGGKNTPTLIDGKDVQLLSDIEILELINITVLKHSYLDLQYTIRRVT